MSHKPKEQCLLKYLYSEDRLLRKVETSQLSVVDVYHLGKGLGATKLPGYSPGLVAITLEVYNPSSVDDIFRIRNIGNSELRNKSLALLSAYLSFRNKNLKVIHFVPTGACCPYVQYRDTNTSRQRQRKE